MRSLQQILHLGSIGLVSFLLPGILAAAGQPVSVSELDFWLRAGRTSGEIVAEINQRGLLEPVNADAQRRLRGNGADAALLARLNDTGLVVSADAASQARQELAALAEKDRINRALALQQLRAVQPAAAAPPSATRPGGGAAGETPAGAAPPGGQQPPPDGATPSVEIAAFPEPIGSGADGWKISYANACRLAAKEHKMVLLDFTGSDWCAPCQRLEQEVFSTVQFKEYAAQKLILVRVDFPKRTLQPKEVKEQNTKLAQAYGVKEYPTMFLLNEQAEPITKLSYTRGGPLPFLARLKAVEAKLKQ